MRGKTIPIDGTSMPGNGLPDETELQKEIDQEYVLDPLQDAEVKAELDLRQKLAQYVGESGAKIYIYDLDEKTTTGGTTYLEVLNLSDTNHDELMDRLRDITGVVNLN